MRAKAVRKGKKIQSIETRKIEVFDSINKAKKHSRKTYALGEISRVDVLLPPLKGKE